MKLLVSILVFGSTLAAQAANKSANFSAFINNNVLYATILGDGCNSFGGGLNVSPSCDKERLTDNIVSECKAQLSVISTQRACRTVKPYPAVTLAIDLADTKVDPTAQYLLLNYDNEVARLKINRDNNSEMSAFTQGNNLYLTVLGDNCNAMDAKIKVEGLCYQGRLTQNYVDTCSADVVVMSTKRMCIAYVPQAHTFTIDLEKAKVAKEAKVLNLKYNGKVISVQINK
jgi:hypothetical protein